MACQTGCRGGGKRPGVNTEGLWGFPLPAEHQGAASSLPRSLQAHIPLSAPKHPLSPSQGGLGTARNKGSAASAPACCIPSTFHSPFVLWLAFNL